jgi:hypothetical protein
MMCVASALHFYISADNLKFPVMRRSGEFQNRLYTREQGAEEDISAKQGLSYKVLEEMHNELLHGLCY